MLVKICSGCGMPVSGQLAPEFEHASTCRLVNAKQIRDSRQGERLRATVEETGKTSRRKRVTLHSSDGSTRVMVLNTQNQITHDIVTKGF